MNLQLLITAAGLGIAYSAAPGAVNTEALRRGLARGFRPALLVQLGALVGDAVWAALALSGSSFILHERPLQIVLGVTGGCFLVRMAWSALQQAWAGGLPGAPGRTSHGDFGTGLFFSIANPFGLAFWSGLGSGFAGVGPTRLVDFALLLGGFAAGAATWCLGAAAAVGWGRRFVKPVVLRCVSLASGLALGYFGLRLLWQTLHSALDEPLLGSRLRRLLAPLLTDGLRPSTGYLSRIR